MTDLIPLSKLNSLRHKSCPKSPRSLRHHAMTGKIPGCVMIYGGWHVDLEAYDKALAEQLDALPSDASNDQLDTFAANLLHKLEYGMA